ncbi:MAG TPA: hypothetical protein VFA09_06065 [Ktedonobacteraceae bacterium]|nr:hypothetical protein [Ktedonobacteraceae bacterium]
MSRSTAWGRSIGDGRGTPVPQAGLPGPYGTAVGPDLSRAAPIDRPRCRFDL